MKIALSCDSLLLQRALEEYLKGHIVGNEAADIIICDKLLVVDKPIFLVSHGAKAHLRIPFTKAELFWELENFYIQMMELDAVPRTKEQMQPFIEKLNKKHQTKIAKLARKIS